MKNKKHLNLDPKVTRLFVVGHARSGTTILAEVLNSCTSVALLIEVNGYQQDWNRHFTQEFNKRHIATGHYLQKGRYITPLWDGYTPREVLDQLGKSFHMVGEKIAFGPHGVLINQDHQDKFLDHHYAHFLGANYLFSSRAPKTTLISLRKLFPRPSVSQLIFGWLRSLETIITGVRTFPNSVLLPLEWLSSTSLNSILANLKLEGQFSSNWIEKKSATNVDLILNSQGIYDELSHAGDLDGKKYLDECEELYASVIELLDRNTLGVRLDVMRFHFDFEIIPKIRELISRLNYITKDTNVVACVVDGRPRNVGDLGTRKISALVLESIQSSLFDENSSNLLIATDDLLHPEWAINNLSVKKSIANGFQLAVATGSGGHKHFGQHLLVEPGRVVTFRVTVRGLSCSNVMLQIGDDAGFVNAAFDINANEVRNLQGEGGSHPVSARMLPTSEGDIQLCLSGLICSSSIWVWIYLLDPSGQLDYEAPENYALSITDLFLSYRRSEAGLDRDKL